MTPSAAKNLAIAEKLQPLPVGCKNGLCARPSDPDCCGFMWTVLLEPILEHPKLTWTHGPVDLASPAYTTRLVEAFTALEDPDVYALDEIRLLLGYLTAGDSAEGLGKAVRDIIHEAVSAKDGQ